MDPSYGCNLVYTRMKVFNVPYNEGVLLELLLLFYFFYILEAL